MSQHLIIKNGKFVARIYLAFAFIDLPLANVRKLWKLMFDEAWNNEETIAVIRDWLPKITDEAKAKIPRLEAELITAQQDAETQRRIVTALGTSLDTKIEQAKRQLRSAKRKGQPETVARAQVFLYDAMKPKTERLQAVKNAKRIENEIKTANQNQSRLEKMQIIFNEMSKK